ncbi:hypothetical protein LCGC14_1641570 [marine sediment metagenome]|uniref:Glycoside hydrolase family 13 N-terminal domain-containing protein n=1 Tax=marine sediment metagenome TaxID=412755 RepID=A0A0F9HZD2_9ZZZZ
MVTVTDREVAFSFYRPMATQVFVAGDFNGWRPAELPMKRNDEGYWQAKMALPPGVFKFRYCADGLWYCDFASFGIEYGPFGPNSVVRVARRPLPV